MGTAENGLKHWNDAILKPFLDKTPERDDAFRTESGIPVKRLYTPADLEDWDYREALGYPGDYPYTRGVYPTMYRGRLWTMRNYAGFGTAADTNRRFRYLLDQGMVGLSMAFDLPTQLGYDSDDPLAEGAVGRVGVAVDSLEDMEIIFQGIPLDKVSTSMTINAPAAVLLAMYIAVAEKQGVPQSKLMGTTQNDILKEFIARGTYIFPPQPSIKLVLDIVEYCARNVPKWNTLNITGYHFRETGANAVQELAFTLADGVEYIEQARKRGMEVDYFAPRLSYSLGCYMDLFEEVCKFRAARKIYADIMKHRFQAQDPKSYQFRIFTGSCGSTLVDRQPMNNIVRIAMHTLMGILGGDQAIHTASWDEGYAIPSESAALLALRTQQILAHECGLTNTVDPLAGSYYVESLTRELEKRAVGLMDRIDGMGGMLAAIENGFVFKEIQEASVAFQQRIETGERVVVGLNKYQMDTEDEMKDEDIFQLGSGVEEQQRQKVALLRDNRYENVVEQRLDTLRRAVDRNENLMLAFIDAVKAYATVGEICGVLREQWGEYPPSTFV